MSAPRIFDRQTYALRRTRADRKNAPSFLVDEAVESVRERVSVANRRFTNPSLTLRHWHNLGCARHLRRRHHWALQR
jgi:hypothetical protein